MKTLLLGFLISAAVLLALDAIWLGTTLDTLYKPNMPGMVRPDPNLYAAAGFYVIYALGLSYLVIKPHLSSGPVTLTLKAAAYGLAAFATYDLTGLATLNNWSLKLSLIDMAWGTFAAIVAANATAFLLRAIGQTK